MIRASNVSVILDGVTRLHPIDLQVTAGEAVAIRGDHGCGRTTLLQVLAGHLEPTTGEALIGGQNVGAERGPRVAGLIDTPEFAEELTTREQVALAAATGDVPDEDARVAADRILSELGIEHLADRFPHLMSAGEAQLVGLAVALARPSDVLLLDEPERRLDNNRIEALLGILNRLRREGMTIVLATHSDRLADAIADRSVTLEV